MSNMLSLAVPPSLANLQPHHTTESTQEKNNGNNAEHVEARVEVVKNGGSSDVKVINTSPKLTKWLITSRPPKPDYHPCENGKKAPARIAITPGPRYTTKPSLAGNVDNGTIKGARSRQSTTRWSSARMSVGSARPAQEQSKLCPISSALAIARPSQL